jgi:hypothetical protein
LKLFSKELLFHFDQVQALMVSYTFSEISGMQVLMGSLARRLFLLMTVSLISI